jgi:V8-like Glu-specific endopeptidase
MEKNNNPLRIRRNSGHTQSRNKPQGGQKRLVAEERKFKERIMECDWIKDEAVGICGEDVEYVDEEKMKQMPHRHIAVAHHQMEANIIKSMDNNYLFGNEDHLQEPPRYRLIEEGMLQLQPHNCIGMVRLSPDAKGRPAIATGILISKWAVLTSAHMLFYNHGLCIRMKRPLTFSVNLHRTIDKAQTVEVADFRWPREYENIFNRYCNCKPDSDKAYQLFLEGVRHDYALLKLKEPIEVKDSLYPVLVSDFTEMEMLVTVCGYKEVTKEEYFQIMHSNALRYSQHGGRYDIDTYSGQSGGPVFFMEKLNGEEVACVVGVHKGYDKIANLNICALITGEVVGSLEKWMTEMGLAFRVEDEDN